MVTTIGDFFNAAAGIVHNVEGLVEDRISSASANAERLASTANGVIERLGSVDLKFNAGAPPEPPTLDPSVPVSFTLPDVSPTSFGQITGSIPTPPSLGSAPFISSRSIPTFVSSVGSLSIPTPPAWEGVGEAPAAPTVQDVTLPAAPDLVLPSLPTLTEISVPDFGGLLLPALDASAPDFVANALPGAFGWSEPTYHPELLEEVADILRQMWAGGSGLPPLVEQAMIDRATEREQEVVRREIADVAEDFSGRGFTLPTGMQAARVDRLREALATKKLALHRDLTIQIAQWQIENMRFAVQQAIAAENVYVNLFLNTAARLFEAAKFEIESQVTIYNAQVALFNAKMNGFEISAKVYDMQVKAEIAKIDVFKVEVEAEIARGQVNEQRVRVYTAQVQALSTRIEIYKAQMQGAEAESGVIRNRIEGYRASVQAYGEQIQAQKVRFEAYESQVKGESAKAGIIDAEARAYAAMVQGAASAADIEIKRADVTIQNNRTLIQAYTAQLEAEKARMQSQFNVIETASRAYIADTQRYSALAGAEGARARVLVSAKETELRSNIAFFEAQSKHYLGTMEHLIRKAGVAVEALKGAGSISSTLAAGAMAGVHVGANLSGGGSINASGSGDAKESLNFNHNYKHDDD